MMYKKQIAISEILILIIGIIAISYALGSEIKVVSGAVEAGAGAGAPAAPSNFRFLRPFQNPSNTISDTKKITNWFKEAGEDLKGITRKISGDWFVDNPVLDYLAHAAAVSVVAAFIAGLIRLFASKTGEGFVPEFTKTFLSAFTAYVTASAIKSLVALVSTSLAGPAGWIVGAVVGWFIHDILLKKGEAWRHISLTCKAWQPENGGSDCAKCNDNTVDGEKIPCEEYQCKSLGQGCELINKESDEPRCVWKNPKDVAPPKISPWEEVLSEGYSYKNCNDRGCKIKLKDPSKECLPAFSPFTFGIELDKEGYCKIDSVKTAKFEDMENDFGGSNLRKKEHQQTMTFPGSANYEEAGIEIYNDGDYKFYVRCESVNDKANIDEFVFEFCVEKGPDNDDPRIEGFNWLDKAPVQWFDETEEHEVLVEAYVNEPAKCKWSRSDRDYKDMENDMVCSSTIFEFNAQLTYTCASTLTGLENSKENKFYFRCKDNAGNTNKQSYPLTLVGTTPLVMSSVGPNEETIKGSTENVKVTLKAQTSAGYNNGESTCYYSDTGDYDDYIVFDNTGSYEHSTDLYMLGGSYDFFVKCVDPAGNIATGEISFEVESDFIAPLIARAYYEGGDLKLITSESAECVYDTTSCSYAFEDGISIISSDDLVHSITWDTDNNLYIKCQDEYGNKPAPDKCSIILRPFEFF